MTTRCLTIEEIARLRTAGATDPGRRHVDACARCSALALAYAEFVGAEPAEGADVGDAGRRLSAFIAEHIERGPIAAAASRRPPRRWFEFTSPGRMWTLVASAAVVAVLAVSVARREVAPDEMLLRGTADGAQLAAYTVAANGSIPLIWAPIDGADSYRITILREDLSELARIGPVGENSLAFAPAAHSLAVGRYFWEVTALAGGDPVAWAGPAPLIVR
ncbi:MAG TPA: hypothetical protein VFT13_09090 [Candidatus Krumholzibacteria bacterium]|nr:hypothetical protein [Candidatus Krumholzibacteria bacterium]